MKEEFIMFRDEIKEIEKKKAAVSIDDITLLRKNLFELRDAQALTDEIVKNKLVSNFIMIYIYTLDAI
jgi:hypothetical protein